MVAAAASAAAVRAGEVEEVGVGRHFCAIYYSWLRMRSVDEISLKDRCRLLRRADVFVPFVLGGRLSCKQMTRLRV